MELRPIHDLHNIVPYKQQEDKETLYRKSIGELVTKTSLVLMAHQKSPILTETETGHQNRYSMQVETRTSAIQR